MPSIWTRRAFAQSLAAFAAPARTPPNILLLLADNWAFPHASIYGDASVKTPVFDELARQGTLFTNAVAPNPSCSPSRSSLLSGQETHRLGTAASLYGNLPQDLTIYPDLLSNAGYLTGYSEKGWGPGTFRRNGKAANPAGAPFDDFAAMLASRKPGQPFCFWFGSHDPHVPWDRGLKRKAEMPLDNIKVPAHLPDNDVIREDIRSYYCEVQQFDTECGDILEQLRKTGELDNTLVVMTSDNGWQMPRGLANCYDLGVRIPMAIRWPKGVTHAARRDDFISIADLCPTFLESANLPKPTSVTAHSLNGKVRRDHMFLERERHANVRQGDLSYPVRGLRTKEYLYLRNLEPDRWPAGDPTFYWAVGEYGDIDESRSKRSILESRAEPFFSLNMGKRPAEELYDLKKDPDQVTNLARIPAYSSILARLSKRVDAWMRSTSDPRAKGPTDFWDRAPYSGAKRKQK